MLDWGTVFLNHGSFGACPRGVLDEQRRLREAIELAPVRFLARELEGLLDSARATVASFVGADPAGVAFVPNATTAVNSVLRSLELHAGDELVTTDHEYNASRNILEFVATRAGARVITAPVPFPIGDEREAVEAVLGALSSRTRLVLLDHVSSQTALVFPIESIAGELSKRGIDLLVDGAHAPGMLPLDLRALDVPYYTGNLHKWVCAPKGAAFLYVREDRRELVRPAIISHGANSIRTDRSRYLLEFDWMGTVDPTPWLAVPEAIRTIGSLVSGGWPEVMRINHELALEARQILCGALEIPPTAPDSMIGSMASVPLPPSQTSSPARSLYGDPLQDALYDRFGIEVPVIPWPAPPARVLRISAQLYNSRSQYELLATALVQLLQEGL
ncbi:MAG: aminotransferase class V-fold PLP-dependent enzyme [Thermoanaerobaculia bacterium]